MQDVLLTGERSTARERRSKWKSAIGRLAMLTFMGLLLGLAQGWAAARTYKPTYQAGFHTGLLHGMLLPAALPGLLLGQKLPIYAPNNSGNPYEIGYIFGINTCGFIFFGTAFWQKQKKQQLAANPAPYEQ